MSRVKNSAVKSTFGKEHVDYVMQYGGKCRDCADRDGICETTGISCGEKEKAVKYVLDAISYGINNGYIPNNCKPVQAQENLKAKRQSVAITDAEKANLLNTSDWALSWSIERNVDREYCEKLSEILTAFMAYLIDKGYSVTTIRRHKRNLTTFGFVTVKNLWGDGTDFENPDTIEAVKNATFDGGPLLSSVLYTDEEQKSMDATCKKLQAFMLLTYP